MYPRENFKMETNMASFRETREVLLLAYDEDLINDEEFVLLYNLNTSKNFDYHYWNYNRFDLNNWSDEECRGDLRFYKADVYRLFEELNLLCYVMWNLFTVGSLQFFNDSTIASLEANQNRPKYI